MQGSQAQRGGLGKWDMISGLLPSLIITSIALQFGRKVITYSQNRDTYYVGEGLGNILVGIKG